MAGEGRKILQESMDNTRGSSPLFIPRSTAESLSVVPDLREQTTQSGVWSVIGAYPIKQTLRGCGAKLRLKG